MMFTVSWLHQSFLARSQKLKLFLWKQFENLGFVLWFCYNGPFLTFAADLDFPQKQLGLRSIFTTCDI